eukprot:3439068-Prorocentrum_lima.AAC.1
MTGTTNPQHGLIFFGPCRTPTPQQDCWSLRPWRTSTTCEWQCAAPPGAGSYTWETPTGA